MNSFKSIREACAYEAQRQLKQFQEDRQEFVAGYKNTMNWDEEKGVTNIMRTKNSFVDYRFTTEPDIKPFTVSEELIANALKQVGELPEAKRQRYKKEYGMTDFDVETITSTKDLAMFFEDAASKSKNPKKAVNIILAELLAVLNEKKETINDVKITPAHIAELADALEDGKITSKQGKEVFAEMMASNKMPSAIIKEKGMEVVSDAGAIDKIVQDVIAANPKAVEDYKSGKTNVVGWLMGQVMKMSQGKANPKQATEALNKYLSQM